MDGDHVGRRRTGRRAARGARHYASRMHQLSEQPSSGPVEPLVVGFDLDMTLIDSRPGIHAVFTALAAENSADTAYNTTANPISCRSRAVNRVVSLPSTMLTIFDLRPAVLI